MFRRNVNRVGKQCNTVEDIVRYIAAGQAKNIVVMVGAGISTASGIPDFRWFYSSSWLYNFSPSFCFFGNWTYRKSFSAVTPSRNDNILIKVPLAPSNQPEWILQSFCLVTSVWDCESQRWEAKNEKPRMTSILECSTRNIQLERIENAINGLTWYKLLVIIPCCKEEFNIGARGTLMDHHLNPLSATCQEIIQ